MTDSIPTELQEQIQAIQALPGRVSLYFENLKNGYRAQYNSTLPTIAASVINSRDGGIFLPGIRRQT